MDIKIPHIKFTLFKQLNGITFLLIVLFVLNNLPVFAQVSFKTRSESIQVIEHEFFQLTFILKNAKGTQFQGPDFKNFIVLSNPSRFLDTTIINYTAAGELLFSYSLLPKKRGKFKIPPASILINGKRIQSNAIAIEVLKDDINNRVALKTKQAFVKIEVDTNEVYLGQQVVLNYKLYSTTQIETYYFTSESKYHGFFQEDTHHFDSSRKQETKDGISYTTKILKKVVLFPQRTGLQTIEPITIRLGVLGRALFRIDRFSVSSNALEINVKPLSEAVPSNFSGAVGHYTMKASISKTKLTTDDVLKITLLIQGNGDIKRLQAPPLKFPPSFELYEPKIIQESSEESNGLFIGQKTIEYLVLPKESGAFTLSPSFTYFDPEDANFITLNSATFQLDVQQGNGVSFKEALPITPTKKSIRPIKAATDFSQKRKPFPTTNLFFILLILPILIFILIGIYHQIGTIKKEKNLALSKKNRAKKLAIKHLDIANQFLKANNSHAFYEAISRALLGYVCLKLRIPLSELTKDKVQEKLASLPISPQTVIDFMAILKTTEVALFARTTKPNSIKKVYEKSVKVISQIELDLIFDTKYKASNRTNEKSKM